MSIALNKKGLTYAKPFLFNNVLFKSISPHTSAWHC